MNMALILLITYSFYSIQQEFKAVSKTAADSVMTTATAFIYVCIINANETL